MPTYVEMLRLRYVEILRLGYVEILRLGNYLVCKRFAVQTLLWPLEFVIQTNLEHDTMAYLKIITNAL